MTRFKAILGLLLVAAFWGMTFPIVKGALTHISSEAFVTGRFALAAVILLPSVLLQRRRVDRHTLWAGAALGLLNGLVYLLLTASLEHISASRSALLVGTNVALVPFMSHAVGLSKVRGVDLLSVGLCLCGLYWLTGADLHGIGYGDFLMLGCELFFAMSLVLMAWVTRRRAQVQQLTFYQIIFTVPLPLLITLGTRPVTRAALHPEVLWPLAFCALAATVLPLLLQAHYMGQVSAPTAALVLSLEPVFAALFAHWVYQEPITLHMAGGAALMFLAALAPELAPVWPKWRAALAANARARY